MKCPLCGEQAAQDDLFCGNCGYNLLQDREETPEPEVAVEATLGEVAEGAQATGEQPSSALPTATLTAAGPAAKGKTSTWLIVLVVAALLFLCCCCGSVALYLISQPSY